MLFLPLWVSCEFGDPRWLRPGQRPTSLNGASPNKKSIAKKKDGLKKTKCIKTVYTHPIFQLLSLCSLQNGSIAKKKDTLKNNKCLQK